MTRPVTRPSILVVHRDPSRHAPLLARLRAEGVACAEAQSSEQALVVLAALRFDYVLLDVEEPAHALASQLRERHPHLRPIAVGTAEDGSVPTLPPSFEPEQLLERLR